MLAPTRTTPAPTARCYKPQKATAWRARPGTYEVVPGSEIDRAMRAKGTPQEANEPDGPHCYRSTHGAAKRPPTPLRHRSTRSLNPLADAPPHKASPIFITLHTSHLIRLIRLIRVLSPPRPQREPIRLIRVLIPPGGGGGGFKFGGEGIICYFCR